MYDQIAKEIRAAMAGREKTVTIHYIVLTNAKLLQNVDPKEFCIKIGIEETWAVEVRKMLSLAKLLDKNGLTIAPK